MDVVVIYNQRYFFNQRILKLIQYLVIQQIKHIIGYKLQHNNKTKFS